ncbi:hypothetical protein [Sphingobacterium sp. G1-14]|uniref:hypothetical protein n=1 Tax=Sphingobacterium sp. G1-14 TaxID=2003121 RepID=UPI0012FD0977|nr:hypothetical protein [Sphingobacterium sp. G1-14]
MLETVKGFFRLSTSVFPCTGYCISSAFRLSQHRTVGEPAPSEAVPQLSLSCNCHCAQWYWYTAPISLKPNVLFFKPASCSITSRITGYSSETLFIPLREIARTWRSFELGLSASAFIAIYVVYKQLRNRFVAFAYASGGLYGPCL